MNLENKKVFIAGSTGFIGSRLAEILYLKKSAEPVCLVHDFANAARLARLPVKMVKGDVLDRGLLEDAMVGCQTVFNCAFGKTGNEDLDKRINEEGIRNILIIAKKNRVKRVVHISTIAVYGDNPPQEVNEETPTIYTNWTYGDSKLISEKICKEYIDKGLEVVIVRPTIVYGPFSPNWTINAIKRVQHGGWEKIESLDGWCNPIYIDDLVQGLILCAEKEEAVGQTFILSGDKAVTWNDYFKAYNKLCNLPPLKESSEVSLIIRAFLSTPLKWMLKQGRKHFERHIFELYQDLQRKTPKFAKKMDSIFRGSIQPEELRFFKQKSRFSIGKARSMLGFNPDYSFEKGMEITGKWLKHHGYLD